MGGDRVSGERTRHPALPGPQAQVLALQRAVGNRAVNQWLQSAASDQTRGDETTSFIQLGLNSGRHSRLDPATRGVMGSVFGRDFSNVRIHTDEVAARSAQKLGAAAYTLGQDVIFNKGYFAPDTEGGLRLLAHELVHVAQWQNAGRPSAALQSRAMETAPQPAAEAEAHRLVNGLGRSQAAVVRGSARPAGVLLHPIYISRHGSRGFLQNARDFFTRWGYSPIRTGVDSIEEILHDLAGQGSIGRVTIVTHAHPTNLFIGLFSGGGNQVAKDDWQVDTAEELLDLETHYISEDALDNVIRDLQRDRTHRQRLERIGSPTDPIVRQFLWWALEYIYVDEAGFEHRRRSRLKRLAERNMNRYRDTILFANAFVAGFGGPVPTERDFERLRQSIRDVTRNLRWPRPGRGQRRIERQLERSPTQLINRVLRESFFQDLEAVRAKIRRSSWIEVQGCRAGQDRDYLVQMQSFFSNGATRPKVTAPRWFQFFGYYAFTSVPDNVRQMRRLWGQRGVRAALEYWYPIITGSPLPDNPTHETLREYLRTPNVLPLARGDRPGEARVLFLEGRGEEAYLRWLSRHSYRLTRVPDIQDALFTRRSLRANIRNAVVDWLQEERSGRTRMLFRPDPEYNQQIEEVT